MGIKRGGDLALSVLSAHLTGQRPGQMIDGFLRFSASDRHAHAGAERPLPVRIWSVMRIMADQLQCGATA